MNYRVFNSFVLIVFILFNVIVCAQDQLYMPLNIKEAYNNGTRSYDGTPGSEYWQNSADYKINVEIDPFEKMLYGSEEIEYYNNSPDTLKILVIRLYQNVFKRGTARDYSVNEKAINKGIEITNLTVRGVAVNDSSDIVQQYYGTNLYLKLDEFVPPKSVISLLFDWNFIIPHETTLRMGAYDSTSFYIGYWYPQVSVYDDVDGWDRYNYGGQVEFYNDFSNFDVSITVPNKFAVWGTGELQNAADILSNKYLDRFNDAKNSDEVVRIITADEISDNNKFNNSSTRNTWHYKASNVTDFAFAISDHYLWDGVTTTVTGKPVFVQTAYKKESKDFYNVAKIAKDAIEFFSNEMPGVPFPYPALTVFNGSGGMEYPMMINDGSARTLAGTVGVTSHEIAHTYFPFYMGTNERKYAFMDEGWAVMLPYDFQQNYVESNDPRKRQLYSYNRYAGTELDMPLMVPSINLRGRTYRMSAYARSGAAYELLYKMLGKETFLKGLHEFMERWNGKHPGPYDFFYTFNDVVNENLNWYWRPWFFDFGYPDLSIKDVQSDGNEFKILISKEGNIPIPVKLTIEFEDETEMEVKESLKVWSDGKNELIVTKTLDKIPVRLTLGDKYIPDANKDNNEFNFRQ